MGYTERGSITDFWPDDTENVIYIESNSFLYDTTIESLDDIIKAKWPDASISDIKITAENIHTHCIYYDRHDSGDYTTFIVLTRK